MPEDCSNCRHHAKQKRPDPLWFEGEKMRTLDDDRDVYLCRAEGGPHAGKDFREPIRCESWSASDRTVLSPELEERMAAALKRMDRRGRER